MKKKKGKDNHSRVQLVHYEVLSFKQSEYDVLFVSVQSAKTIEKQISCIKFIALKLKESVQFTEIEQNVLKFLCQNYAMLGSGTPMKRAISSSLSSISLIHLHEVMEAMYDTLSFIDVDKYNPNTCNFHLKFVQDLLENFSVGEKVVEKWINKVLLYLFKVAKSFEQGDPFESDELLSDQSCLFCIKLISKVISKCVNNNNFDLCTSTLVLIEEFTFKLLQEESVSSDIRFSASMCYVIAACNVHSSFHEYIFSLCLKNFEGLPISSLKLVFLYYGLFTMMDCNDICTDVEPGLSILSQSMNCFEGIWDADFICLNRVVCFQFIQVWCQKLSTMLQQELKSTLERCYNGQIFVKLFQLCVAHWYDSYDLVKFLSKAILKEIVNIETAFFSSNGEVFSFIVSSVMSLHWFEKLKLDVLNVIVQASDVRHLLSIESNLPECILSTFSQQNLANAAAYLFENSIISYKSEVEGPGWQDIWIKPLVASLCSKDTQPLLLTHLLPKLVKHSEIINCLLNCLAFAVSHEASFASLAVLKLCRQLTNIKSIAFSKDKVYQAVLSAGCHHLEYHRLYAVGILCENKKQAELICGEDLTMLEKILPCCMRSSDTAFRQQLVSYLSKLCFRLSASIEALKSSNKNAESNYNNFLSFLVTLSFSHLQPRSSFNGRCTALQVLATILKNCDTPLLTLFPCFRPEYIPFLLECLMDTYEQNSLTALECLSILPSETLGLNEPQFFLHCLSTGLRLSESCKPHDGVSASYIFRFLSQKNVISVPVHLVQANAQFWKEFGVSAASEWNEMLVIHSEFFIQCLLHSLQKQIDLAKQSLKLAVTSKPMYPSILCLRHILGDKQSIPASFLPEILTLCLQAAEIVSPIMAHDSPEGNCPEELFESGIIGPGLEIDVHLFEEDNSSTVRQMSEYLVVCCWRTIKEVSLLFGYLSTRDVGQETMRVIGEFFSNQLLQSKHRGAFELAYTGFVMMSKALWKSTDKDMQQWPQQWTAGIMQRIFSSDNSFCITRRSAGLPLFLRAIFVGEHCSGSNTTFISTMNVLLDSVKGVNRDYSDSVTIHCCNILRALLSEAQLSVISHVFVERVIYVAIIGYSSKLWTVRNVSTLLISTLMTKLFGVHHSTAESDCKMSSQTFFLRYPLLTNSLLSLLENSCKSASLTLDPGLYPSLLILARLYPVESSKGILKKFIPMVIECSCSPVYSTRLMACQALTAIVGADDLLSCLQSLWEKLNHKPVSHNQIHGSLLMMIGLLKNSNSFGSKFQQNAFQWIHKQFATTNLIDSNCFLIRRECINLLEVVVSFDGMSDQLLRSRLWNSFLKAFSIQEYLLACSLPGFLMFMSTVLQVVSKIYLKFDCFPAEQFKCELLKIISGNYEASLVCIAINALRKSFIHSMTADLESSLSLLLSDKVDMRVVSETLNLLLDLAPTNFDFVYQKVSFDFLHSLSSHPNPAVSLPSLKLLNIFMPKLPEKEALQVLDVLSEFSSCDNPLPLRNAVGAFFSQNRRLLLYCSNFQMKIQSWGIYLTLLQDEDEEVRYGCNLQKNVCADIALFQAFNELVESSADEPQLICACFLNWICNPPMQKVGLLQTNKTRLFENNEMNVYQDEEVFILLCSGKLKELLQECCDSSKFYSIKIWVDRNISALCSDLRRLLTEIDCSSNFTYLSSHEEYVRMRRTVIALHALDSDFSSKFPDLKNFYLLERHCSVFGKFDL